MTEYSYKAKDQEIPEPEIFSQDRNSNKKDPQNKSPSSDGIPNEAIKTCKEIVVQ